MPKPGFHGTHCDVAMLPGPTERLVPEAEGAMDENLDPHPTILSLYVHVQTSMYWYMHEHTSF